MSGLDMARRLMRRTNVAALAALAGRALGARRRGSILVLILGALAMLSVVTLVYVVVGQGDRRTGAVVADRNSIDDSITRIRDYIAVDVIGADALSTFIDGVDPALVNGDPSSPGFNPSGAILRREAIDYPVTDRMVRSTLPQSLAWARFGPTGTHRRTDVVPQIDLRTPTDPWLADAEPSWLGPHPVPGSLPPYVRLDWRHISNIAPSGNFVNLFNLRNNFDAPSGFDQNGRPLANGMSDRLSLLDPISSLGGPPPVATQQLDYVDAAADPNVPAHWDSRQRGAARPARDLRYLPGDPDYALYQWADADGDGVLDARLTELVDVSDFRNPVSLLPRDDRFRYFVAARIIDLSGRLNVNTATDFRSRPTRDAPAGVTPAEADLLRLLTMADIHVQYPGAGYDLFQQPLAGFFPEENYTGYAQQTGLIGEVAYRGLRESIRDRIVPPPGPLTSPLIAFNADQRVDYFLRFGAHAGGASYSVTAGQFLFEQGGLFNQADLLELLSFNGVNDPTTLSRLEQAAGGGHSAPTLGNPPSNLSPLRDNRRHYLERDSVDDFENQGNGNGILDLDAVTRLAFDVRQRLTPFSASRPIRSALVLPGFETELDLLGDLKVDANESLRLAADGVGVAPGVFDPDRRDAGQLFGAYADALLPHSWRRSGASVWSRTQNAELRTLNYGNDPELAIWTAAHLTANLIDSFDRDLSSTGNNPAGQPGDQHIPSGFSLAIAGDPTSLGQLDGAQPSFPFWTPRSQSGPRPGTLDLDHALGLRQTNNDPPPPGGQLPPSRLADGPDLGQGARAINVFGVEAQPFIVEVATLYLYTDAPVAAYTGEPPGAEEYEPPPGPGPVIGPTIDKPATINGTMTDGNPDFLCQVLAFQITNPFDEDIGLTKGDTGAYPNGAAVTDDDFSDYYIEFGGRLYKLAEVSQDGSTLQQVILRRRDPSGQTRTNTRVFYVLNDSFDNIRRRIKAAVLPSTFVGSFTDADAERWFKDLLKRQIALTYTPPSTTGEPSPITIDPIQIPRMNAMTGQMEPGFKTVLSPTSGQNRSVKLWRTIRSPRVDLTGPNLRVNDLLADRIADGTDPLGSDPPTLDRALPSREISVTGSVVGPDPTGPHWAGGGISAARDNTGFSIALWSSFKRADDPRFDFGGSMRIPLGALPAYCLEVRHGWGVGLANSLTPGLPLKNFTDPPTPPGTPTLNKSMFTSPQPLGNPERLAANEFLFNSNTSSKSLLHDIADPLSAATPQSALKDTIRKAPEEKSTAAEIMPKTNHPGGGKEFSEIYPEIPLNDRRFEVTVNNRKVSVLRVGDMLLPLAVGPTQIPSLGPEDGWLTLAESLAVAYGYASPVAPAVAQPVRDAFAPMARLFYDPAAPGGRRPRTDRGNLVLDDFAPFENADQDPAETFNPSTDRRRAPGMPLALAVFDTFRTVEPQFASIERGTPGLINLNTAPLEVLRLVPMLTPAVTPAGLADWWGSAFPTEMHQIDSDIAATVAAYRDKGQLRDRLGRLLSFEDFDGGSAPSPGHAVATTLDDPRSWRGRSATSGIDGAREAPGFASVGEMLAAIDSSGQNRVPVSDQIDFLGFDMTPADPPRPQASGIPGVVSVLYRPDGLSTSQPTRENEIPNDYAEKVMLATGAANSATVRSDIFAAWFVVHGYQRSDVEGLGPNDPLVPTIARRYVMVVDRSNVTRRGDKPRILFFTELPR